MKLLPSAVGLAVLQGRIRSASGVMLVAQEGLLLMRLVTLLLCSAALAAPVTSACARPLDKSRTPVSASTEAEMGGMRDFARQDWKARRGRSARHHRAGAARRNVSGTQAYAYSGTFSSSSLVNEARKYLGTNPTGRRSLWCGAFMDMVLKRTGYRGGGNLALGYAKYGHRVSGPQVGAIAVITRRGGGHVGVVSGIDPNGNPIIVSGNHNNTVAEAVYPRSRVITYVMPN